MKSSSARKRKTSLGSRDVRPGTKKRIVLGRDPRVSIPDSEAWLFRSKRALGAVRLGLREAGDGKTVSVGSFARYALEE